MNMQNVIELLKEFKGDRYIFGNDVLDQAGAMGIQFGKQALIVTNPSEWLQDAVQTVTASLEHAGVEVLACVRGTRPNAPREDVYRIACSILHHKPDMVIAIGGGSTIDGCKASAALATFGDKYPEIDPYFGVGQISRFAQETGRKIVPVLPIMTAASSAAHLTKYSNITDPVSGQKKLIVDEVLVPPMSLFDYKLTQSQPISLTQDGALDGISHCLEVYLGVKGEVAAQAETICLCGIEVIISGLSDLIKDPDDADARQLVAAGTDLGGYAIMIGGTNGPHLNSFSWVKQLSHGRACAIMNPYYTAFFVTAVEDRVRKIGEIYKKYGYITEDLKLLSGRELGIAVAKGMISFIEKLGFPSRLQDVETMEKSFLDKALNAAKDPQLESKLQNMPVQLTSDTVDTYMGPVLEAAWSGDLGKIVFVEK